MPAASPVIDWLPLAELLLSPLPETRTDVALVVDQEIVVAPGAVVDWGAAEIDAVTADADADEFTVNVAERVTGPPAPCAVIV